MINKYGQGAAVKISTVLRPVTMLRVEGSSETGLLTLLSNHIFWCPLVQTCMSCEDHLFFEMLKIQSRFSKSQKKI